MNSFKGDKMKKLFYLCFICSLFLLFSVSFAQTETVAGFVEVIDEDDDGNPIDVAISVPAEDEEGYPEYYYLAHTAKSKELYKFIGKTVEAKGKVTEDEDGIKTISVSSYQILKSLPPKKKEAKEAKEEDVGSSEDSEDSEE